MIDAEGTYATWLGGNEAAYAVLRPDFYVAATAQTPAQLRDVFERILSGLHLTEAVMAHEVWVG